MPLNQDEARLIAGYLLAQLEQELETTKKVLAALPAGREDYWPHPRSTPALKLAWHIASADRWFLDSILAGKFESGDSGGVPDHIRSGADVAAWYEANLPPAIASLRSAPAETFSRTVDFFGLMRAQGSTSSRSPSSTPSTTADSCRPICARPAARFPPFTVPAATRGEAPAQAPRRMDRRKSGSFGIRTTRHISNRRDRARMPMRSTSVVAIP